MYKPNSFYVNVNAIAHREGFIGKDIPIDLESINKIKTKVYAKLERVEDFTSCWCKIAEEDNLPKYYWGVDNAFDKAMEMRSALEEAIDAVDDILNAWSVLEQNLDFIFNYVEDKAKGVIA